MPPDVGDVAPNWFTKSLVFFFTALTLFLYIVYCAILSYQLSKTSHCYNCCPRHHIEHLFY